MIVPFPEHSLPVDIRRIETTPIRAVVHHEQYAELCVVVVINDGEGRTCDVLEVDRPACEPPSPMRMFGQAFEDERIQHPALFRDDSCSKFWKALFEQGLQSINCCS